MNLIPTANWLYTSKNEPRGYIDSQQLRELWFHTGTACNLACPFCLEGSKPGDDRLQLVTLEDLKPYIDEAVSLGVQQFSFTGGEPFDARGLPEILAYAAQSKPCLVLTNGTDAVLNRKAALKALVGTAHPISFRVSIDYPDAERHDQGRGDGNFDLAWRGLKLLSDMGYAVSIARQVEREECAASVDAEYRRLCKQYSLPEDTKIVAFPDFLRPFQHAAVPEITETCMTRYQTQAQRESYMCAFSKMLVKQNGRMKIYACTLVDDDPRFGFDGTLAQSLTHRTMLAHHRCYSCFASGASCSEL